MANNKESSTIEGLSIEIEKAINEWEGKTKKQ